MSQSLRAQFDLQFNVGPTEGLTQVSQVLDRIDQALERLRRAVDPFSEMTEPVARATGATNRLNEVLERTTAVSEGVTQATAAVREELSGVGAAATEAGEGLTGMGRQAEEAAEQTVSAVGRMREAVGRLDTLAVSAGGGSGRAAEGGSRIGALGSRINGFRESIDHSVMMGMGAAMTGMGLIEPIHAAADYDNDLTHIGITYGITGDANAPFAKALGQRIDALARQTGQRSGELVGAASFLSQEGYSAKEVDAFLPNIARISTAYNSRPDAVAKMAFSLRQNMGISEGDLGTALAMVARVGKESALPLEQLAPLFPQVAATAGAMHIGGLSGTADLASMLAIIRKNVGTEGEAATDLRRVMSTLTSSHGRTRFKKTLGEDPRAIMDAATDAGKDPLSAVMDRIQALKTPRDREHAVEDLFANLEDRVAASAMTRQFAQMMEIRGRIQNTSPEMIQKDYDTGHKSTLIALNSFLDALTQLQRRIGDAFVPVMNVLTKGLWGLISVFDHLDKATHGWSTVVVGCAGALLAFATAAGALMAILSPIIALGGAISLPFVLGGVAITAAAAAVGAAAYLVIRHWDTVKSWLSTFLGWAKSFGSTLAAIFTHPFDALGNAFSTIENRIANSSIGHMMGLHGAAPIPAGAGGGGQFGLHVTTDPGVRVQQTGGPRPITMGPDRGRMVNRP